MFKPLVPLLLVLQLLSPALYSQDLPQRNDYPAIDSFARRLKYPGDVYRLTQSLTTPYHDNLSKARAIFIWITEHIKYDYKLYNLDDEAKVKKLKYPKCREGEDCTLKMEDWENNYISKILRKRKAICDGYSKLFKRMCNLAGIHCEIISGYTKNKHYQIGKMGKVDHAWNAVYLDSAYYLVDATWAAGFCQEDESSGKLKGPFVKKFDNYYWLTPFDKLSRDHYPEDPKWLFNSGYTREKFKNNPYIEPSADHNLVIISPATGVIRAKPCDTIHFEIEYEKPITRLQVNSNLSRNPAVYSLVKNGKKGKDWVLNEPALRRQQYISFNRDNNRYSFDYEVTDANLNYLDILFNYFRAMRFKVIITP
ncbi:Transglutaminase-like superfamily protein [Chitinophaga terrae (ex Kim and Jung 2007)]|uniref:Transglutaminase-like superfamily protein n=1 Tax=Chitinophaga terrae (ex Kim and Jung 2007) TaxID=408074 RepID=A0A1H4ATP3_9BACT|nr:transglutaminase domain-containing protein [Chitinophaga terrae (ex Kim and Jung 2007)]GEP89148.1 hypothetical protein CTE07_07930 [Chitinophaga terrae (ex Kim and Jung 2007)]SEA39259.1 Transglutaminase-like superfamily protein [Chitinophaga terrae (ex Kim and Jung 2007)]